MLIVSKFIKPTAKTGALFLSAQSRETLRSQGQYSRIETNKVEPTLSTLEKIASAFGIEIEDLIKKDEPITVDSFEKSLVEKVKLIDSLEEEQKSHIYAIIDMAVSNKKLKNTLTNALQGI